MTPSESLSKSISLLKVYQSMALTIKKGEKMFDDIINDKNQFPCNFEIPHDDLVKKILLRDVSDLDGLVDSCKQVLEDLEDFQDKGYQITIADDRITFNK